LFSAQAAEIATLVKLNDDRHRIYRDLVNQRLDSEEPVKEIDPWPMRADFRKLSADLRDPRSKLVGTLQSAVFPSEGQ
jgi:hypothetical protein